MYAKSLVYGSDPQTLKIFYSYSRKQDKITVSNAVLPNALLALPMQLLRALVPIPKLAVDAHAEPFQ